MRAPQRQREVASCTIAGTRVEAIDPIDRAIRASCRWKRVASTRNSQPDKMIASREKPRSSHTEEVYAGIVHTQAWHSVTAAYDAMRQPE